MINKLIAAASIIAATLLPSVAHSDPVVQPEVVITDCLAGITPPILKADNVFLLWNADGCNQILDNYIEIRNETRYCLTPMWEGYSADTKVLSRYYGKLVPAKVTGPDGSDYSCIPSGATAYALVKSKYDKIGAIGWANTSSRLPPKPSWLANGYPAFAMGMGYPTSAGFVMEPTNISIVCDADDTMLADDNNDELRDYVKFSNVRCRDI